MSNIFLQLSSPSQEVPLSPTPALFMSTETWSSIACEGCTDGSRRARPARALDGKRATRRGTAHLAPLFEHPVAQVHDVVELAHVRAHDEHVLLADERRDLRADRGQALLADVRQHDAQPVPVDVSSG